MQWGRGGAIGRWSFVLGAVVLSGCFGKLRRDARIRDDVGRIEGRVEVDGWTHSPILVAAGRLPSEGEKTIALVRELTLREPAGYGFVLEPGNYLVGAVEDVNGNHRHDEGERACLSEPTLVQAGETRVVPLRVHEVYDGTAIRSRYNVLHETVLAHGDVRPLSSEKFGPELASKGLWEPLSFALEETPGVYMLQPYEDGTTPVLFVHGMSGYPREFAPLIRGLDRTRFQPWVVLYPSGYPLQRVADALDGIVSGLASKHGFERFCVVAHSMGGLVARRFIGEQVQGRSAHTVRGLVTLASPLGGMVSAGMGTKVSPGVVPSWYDLDPGGPFVESLYAQPLPSDVEYHLLFAFDEAGRSDGVVALKSQLRVEAQADAEVVRGFRATHTGILVSAAARAQVYTALRRCAGEATAPRIAPRPAEPKVVDDRR